MARQDPPPKGRKPSPSKPPPPSSVSVPPQTKKEKKKAQPPQGQPAYVRWINAHPAMKPWSALILKWSREYNIDALYFAALLHFESGGNPNARSNKNAVGLAQIHLPSHPDVTEAQAKNPAFAIEWGARFWATQLRKHGSPEKAYRQGYNPNYKGSGPFQGSVPRGYVYGTGGAGLDPNEQARVAERDKQLRDRAARPRIQKEEFKQYWNSVNDIFQSYAGRNATHKEALALAKSGLTSYSIIKGLTKRKSFFGSPVWEAKSRDYYGIARDLGMKVDRKLVALAIANNWDGSAFAEKLREQPGYLSSSEFKNTEASLGNIFRSIYGEPQGEHKLQIKEMTLGRWKPDQAAAYFRSLPEYRTSAEYQSKTYELQAALGFLPTQQAPPPPVPGPRPVAPNSPRIKGNPNYG